MRHSVWQRAIAERLGVRDDLGTDGAYERFYRPLGLPERDVLELFDWIRTAFGVSGGVLRPDDDVAILFRPVPHRWFFMWGQNETRAGDRQLEYFEAL